MNDVKPISAAALALCALVSGCAMVSAVPAAARDTAPLVAGARYVAMGSSFASGAGVAPYDPAAPARCQRSTRNYARQLAQVRQLDLVDVTCGGATTAHVVGPWNELPPQVDALTSDTALVTITIGGNDLGYIGGLIAAGQRGGAATPTPIPAQWTNVAAAMTGIVAEIHRRAPRARIVFVDYLTVLPDGAACAQTPLAPAAAATARATAARLARLTADIARRGGAEVLAASRLSRGTHSACGKAPWMAGFIPPAGSTGFVPYHPNLAGMTGIAKALDRQLQR